MVYVIESQREHGADTPVQGARVGVALRRQRVSQVQVLSYMAAMWKRATGSEPLNMYAACAAYGAGQMDLAGFPPSLIVNEPHPPADETVWGQLQAMGDSGL